MAVIIWQIMGDLSLMDNEERECGVVDGALHFKFWPGQGQNLRFK
jgi:hypothetical protein